MTWKTIPKATWALHKRVELVNELMMSSFTIVTHYTWSFFEHKLLCFDTNSKVF